MDLFGALNNAFTGLNRTQDALSVVARNVAGANQPGYVRRTYAGDNQTPGGDVRRVLDSYVQKQLWNETSSSGFTNVQSDYVAQLDAIYGDPASTNTISAKFNAFSSAMKSLQAHPGGSAEQSTVLSTAGALAQIVSTTSNAVQSIRSSTEDALSQSAGEVNGLLASLAKFNQQLSASSGNAEPSLLDSRDAALGQLSELMDISVNQGTSGNVTLTTKSGIPLLDGGVAATLTFNSKSPLAATSLYSSDSSVTGVGTFTLSGLSGGSIDLLAGGAIRGGRIAGLVDLRDTLLLKAQSQLDDLAAGLSSALSDRSVDGSAITNGFEVDLSGIQSGNTVRLDFTDASGKAHRVSIVRVEGASQLPLDNSVTPDPNDEVIGISLAGGLSSAISSLQTGLNELGAGLTAAVGSSANTLAVTASAPASVTSLSATVTNTALQGQGTALPIFIDSSGASVYSASLDGTPQRLGFASRMAVNPALIASPRAFSDYTGSASSMDPTRVNDLVTRLTGNGVAVSPDSGLGLTSGSATVGSIVVQIAQTQANDTNRIRSLNSSQSTVLASIQSRFSQTSGVDMDKELTDLTQLQGVYAANAKVLTAVKEMFDVLMRI